MHSIVRDRQTDAIEIASPAIATACNPRSGDQKKERWQPASGSELIMTFNSDALAATRDLNRERETSAEKVLCLQTCVVYESEKITVAFPISRTDRVHNEGLCGSY